MKRRATALVLAAGALALGSTATGAYAAPLSAAPTATPTDVTAPVAGSPSGKALVRIDGGTAYTKKTGKHSYKLLVPSGAAVKWMGEVSGKGLRAGTFSHNGLVKGWKRLGHRPGAGVMATVTWKDQARLVKVSDPRVNAKGQLVFSGRTSMSLPRTLSKFSLNITRAAKAQRFSDYFDPVSLSDTVQAQASAGGDFSGSVTFLEQTASGMSPCVMSGDVPVNPNPHAFSGYYAEILFFGPATCGDVSFLADTTDSSGDVLTTEVQYKFPRNSNGSFTGYTQLYAWFVVAPGSFAWQGILGQWLQGSDGATACPINGNTC